MRAFEHDARGGATYAKIAIVTWPLPKRVTKVVTAGAIVGTAAVVAWLLLHAREDPPRGDRGPVAIPVASSSVAPSVAPAGAQADPRDAGSDAAVLIDAP